jgi:ribonuclease VapC
VIALDTSAVVAIALDEPEARLFGEIIGSERCLIGAPTVLECHLVLADVPRGQGIAVLDKVLTAPHLEIIAFDKGMLDAARRAFDRFGKGKGHPAKLNICDCMSYAVARHHDVPLLYKGGDFARTDIRSALP